MKKPDQKIHPLLKAFFPVVDCIAELFGPSCEVVLHDVSRPERSIIKIRNGHVTGRKSGDSLTNLGLKIMKDAQKGLEIHGNYNPRTRNGAQLKANTAAIKDSRGRVIGLLCINIDVARLHGIQNSLQKISNEIEDFVRVPESRAPTPGTEGDFEKDLLPPVRKIIDKTVKRIEKSPESFSPKDREEIISAMDEEGIFYVKKSIPWVAESLGLSIPSVYRYLEKVRLNKHKAKGDGLD